MIYILAFIVLIGVIVFVHELGHFWAARSVGVGVERFSVGMPPNFIDFTKTKKGLVVDIFFFAFHNKKLNGEKYFLLLSFHLIRLPKQYIQLDYYPWEDMLR